MNLRYVTFFLIGILLKSTYAQADSAKFSCDGVGGVDEWTIYIDTNLKKAAFFDNNDAVIIKLESEGFLESFPSQKVYKFSGKDTDGSKLNINFNQTLMTAFITFDANKASAVTRYAENGCKVDKKFDLENFN